VLQSPHPPIPGGWTSASHLAPIRKWRRAEPRALRKILEPEILFPFAPAPLPCRAIVSMGLKFFNTLTRSLSEFAPLDPAGKKIGVYCCGPTVHDFAHIGNFRTFVFADLVRRYLEFKGYQVTHVTNITDVEDKIIKRVRAFGGSLRDYTGKYETAFLADPQTLGC